MEIERDHHGILVLSVKTEEKLCGTRVTAAQTKKKNSIGTRGNKSFAEL